jgi:hypothetical protein
MPKLETTVNDIQLKSNLVIANDVPLEEWTDTQYPSAKTLYKTYISLSDIAHPIGSILITDSNVSPGDSLGGIWELIDKEFEPKWYTINTANWTNGKAELSGSYCNIALTGHNLALRIGLKPTEDLSDSESNLGQLDVSSYGVPELPYTIFRGVAVSDGGQCTLCYNISQDGTIVTYDALNLDGTHKMSAGESFYINQVYSIHDPDRMLDDFCDKFYWKRIA